MFGTPPCSLLKAGVSFWKLDSWDGARRLNALSTSSLAAKYELGMDSVSLFCDRLVVPRKGSRGIELLLSAKEDVVVPDHPAPTFAPDLCVIPALVLNFLTIGAALRPTGQIVENKNFSNAPLILIVVVTTQTEQVDFACARRPLAALFPLSQRRPNLLPQSLPSIGYRSPFTFPSLSVSASPSLDNKATFVIAAEQEDEDKVGGVEPGDAIKLPHTEATQLAPPPNSATSMASVASGSISAIFEAYEMDFKSPLWFRLDQFAEGRDMHIGTEQGTSETRDVHGSRAP
ncbi:hypothetical protein C8R45DRAFT_921141 [Mycena sanguinolenta]|nr:hypothetical protein C8R45DRAFT_921141 [Mycena sanguinolenta]